MVEKGKKMTKNDQLKARLNTQIENMPKVEPFVLRGGRGRGGGAPARWSLRRPMGTNGEIGERG